MAVVNLTEARIRDLAPGSGIWRDEQVKGLMVVCHKSTKTYAVQGDVRRNGRHIRTVRVKIDRCDRIGLREARNRAKSLMSQIQSGVDPTAGPDETGVTLKAALDHHLSEKQFRPATAESYRYHLDKYLTRFRSRAVADITRTEVRDLYDTLKKQRGQTTASCVMRTLRAVINTAMRMDETIEKNPVAVLRVVVSSPSQECVAHSPARKCGSPVLVVMKCLVLVPWGPVHSQMADTGMMHRRAFTQSRKLDLVAISSDLALLVGNFHAFAGPLWKNGTTPHRPTTGSSPAAGFAASSGRANSP